MIRRFALFFLSLSLCFCSLTGCRKQPEQTETELFQTTDGVEIVEKDAQSETVSVNPTDIPITGTLQTSKLEILPWDSGRANETSGNDLWEVENGYYFLWKRILYYADKSNLRLWIPVCAKPDCAHDSSSNKSGECEAYIPWNLLLKGDRFYFNGRENEIDDFSDAGLYSHYIGSMALDGNDKQLEYYIPEAEEAAKVAQSNFTRPYLLSNCYLYNIATLSSDGLYNIAMYLVDDEGTDVLFETTREDNDVSGITSRTHDLYGDEGIFTSIFGGNFRTFYRVKDRQLYGVDLTNFPWQGGYLEGDTLLAFRDGQGYYQINLNTGEEIKLADAQLESGIAHIMAPNCILESTLLDLPSTTRKEKLEYRQLHPVDAHSLRFFNGEQWFDVTLPEEVQQAGDSEVLNLCALTSDRIFLIFWDVANNTSNEPVAIYQILLTTDTPTLEYLGTLG